MPTESVDISKTTLPSDWTKQYARLRSTHEQFTGKIEELVREMLKAQKIDVHLIEGRTKTEKSFEEKIVRASKSYTDPMKEVTDLSGIRIITYYQEDSENIGKLIAAEFTVDEDSSPTQSVNPSEFGYKSLHYVVSLADARRNLLEWNSFQKLKVEIQVRTVLQHSWAAISHKLQYKREQDIPIQLRRKLFRLAALLELADEEFIDLKNASGQLSEAIDLQLSSGDSNIAIDYLSVQNFVTRSPEVTEFAAHAADVGFSFDDIEEYEEEDSSDAVSDLIALMRILEIQSIKQLEQILRAATSWAADYLAAQYTGNQDQGSRSSTWTVTSAFILELVLLGVSPGKVRLGHLLQLGWGKAIANRVLNVALEFSTVRKDKDQAT